MHQNHWHDKTSSSGDEIRRSPFAVDNYPLTAVITTRHFRWTAHISCEYTCRPRFLAFSALSGHD